MKRAFVIGYPVSHSRSPELFARFAAATGIALRYERLAVAPADLAGVLADLRVQDDVAGANVTVPHKERALALADEATPLATRVGAANVLIRRGPRFIADNTDVHGIRAALAGAGVSLARARVVLLGHGGVARAAAACALEDGAAELVVAARAPERAAGFARAFAARVCALDAAPAADLYVQATPVGMAGAEQRSLLPGSAPAGASVLETVYTPEETPFVREARARGLRVVLGGTLFAEQAAATFERWFGVRPALESAS